MRGDLPSGTVTFLFTDIEGSTRLLHALGPDRYAAALAEHRRALRNAFTTHGGVEVDTQGDAFFVAFPTPQRAAQAAQDGMASLEAGPIRVRMGVHTGTPVVAEEGYVGVDVHRGARVGALAHGGQIVLSPATAGLLDGEPLRDLGTHRLKDFDGATRLFQLGLESFPPLRTPGAIELPSPATRFIGREQELFDAVTLVYDRDPRMLTIVGPGGTGKTRFAIELARLLADEAEGATVFVPLAPVRDSVLVLQAIADRLGAKDSEPAAIAGALRDRRTHAVVDNLEHLLPGCAKPLADLVAAAPSLRIIATSREPLHIQGEVEFDLSPLVGEDAVTLFVERAQAVRADVERSETVGELCKRLDYLPLAVELAAARTKLLPPDQLLERLGQRLDLRGTRDVDERHSTLRATIAWSCDLLDPAEQSLFARLSVFAAGCSLDSAEAVCDADLDTLASLLDKSLLRRRTGRLGEERSWMLETIKEFATEVLATSGEADAIRHRHAERMLEIARSAHLTEDDDEPFDQPAALAERDDLRAALDWAVENDAVLGLEIAVELENFWSAHAPDEGRRRLLELLKRGIAIPERLRARALRVLAGCAHQQSDWELTDASYDESLEVFTEIGDARGVASVQTRLAYRAFAHDKHLARQLIEDSERSARTRFELIEAQNATLLAYLALAEGQLSEAEAQIRRGRECAASLHWAWWETGALNVLAEVALRRGDFGRAELYGREALDIDASEESVQSVLRDLVGLARAALGRGDLERAGTLWGAVCIEGERMPAWEEWRLRWAEELTNEAGQEFLSATEHGRELDLWEAVEIALEEDEGQTVP